MSPRPRCAPLQRRGASLWIAGLGLAFVAGPAMAKPLPPTKLYLHTDGLEITRSSQAGDGCVPGVFGKCGISDARTNTSWLPELRQKKISIPPMDFERFGGDRAMVRAALLSQVRTLLLGIDLQVVLERPPPDQRYSMVVIGGDPRDLGLGSSIAGLAPLDCEDQNPWDITFVFSKSLRDLDAIARVSVQEAAHSYGIEHVRAPDYVMNPEPIGGMMALGKSCLPMDPSPGLSNPDGIKCLHLCEDPSYQNSFAELRALFGSTPLPRSQHPPQVHIRHPKPGNHYFEEQTNLRVDADILNPGDLVFVDISVNDSPFVKNEMFPYAFHLHQLEAGDYRAVVRAHDLHGNIGESEVSFSVGPLENTPPQAPPVRLEQIQRDTIRLTGEAVACKSDRVCYAGTTCQDGLCLRPLPSATGCDVAPTPAPTWLWGLLCLPWARRKSRPRRTAA